MHSIQFRNKLKNGDSKTFASFYIKTYPRLIGYCSLFIKNSKQVEDIVQDCYEDIWRQRKKIDTSKSVESLLFVMLRNKCLNFIKSEKTHHDIYLSDEFTIHELQYLYQLDFTTNEGSSIEEELVESLQEAISILPEKRKNIFIQCKINGRKQKDVAEELGITVKAVEKHIRQAKLQLQKQLKLQSTQIAIVLYMLLN
ncbi:RNA polymerase sigma-70 factor [Saccharicrinis fermentans]|uniref:RNA polymerase sigma factor n=1 Tax=Saccharicrinis fermentans DSM 9555 = JCM 21142 TaxID=869213 RepID=W7Y9L1_9BACT|nr:RNA polymerase sigma-70 factor [Saccharicrinis fermentans]GAF05017.1 RNA polymerase sigma factor [Saccharicrinis fermentans DSM 9555 = JCM 21142]